MELIEVITPKENLNRAYKKVVANKGASGVDEQVYTGSPLPAGYPGGDQGAA